MLAKHEVKEKGMRSMKVLVAKICVAFALICLMQAAPVRAEFAGPVVIVQAATDQGTAEWRGVIPDLPDRVPDFVKYKLAQHVQLVVPGVGVVGEIEDLDITLDGDPAVTLGFSVSAGNFPTTFTITSALVGFPAINNPQALASAGVTLTDGNPGPGNGASLALVAPRTGLYKAEYNGGTTFAELLGPLSLSSGGTVSSNSSTGVQNIAGAVTSIQASYSFQLSAKDLAAGSSNFEVFVPEPASAGLVIGLGALTLFGRKRS